MRKRGFEEVTGFDDVVLPKRSTGGSAGYDFYAYEDVTIPSIWEQVPHLVWRTLVGSFWNSNNLGDEEDNFKPTLVKTNVKAYMEPDVVLMCYNRSSNPFKKGLVLANSVGVIDSDYYNNADNEGNICAAFYNFYPFPVDINKGDKIFQGVFQKFLKADGDNVNAKRTGGIGSTGK